MCPQASYSVYSVESRWRAQMKIRLWPYFDNLDLIKDLLARFVARALFLRQIVERRGNVDVNPRRSRCGYRSDRQCACQ